VSNLSHLGLLDIHQRNPERSLVLLRCLDQGPVLPYWKVLVRALGLRLPRQKSGKLLPVLKLDTGEILDLSESIVVF